MALITQEQQDLDRKHPKPLTETLSEDVAERSRLPLSKRILRVLWDSLDKTPEERRFVAKIDWWILSYCCVAYFVKYLDQTNVSAPKMRCMNILADLVTGDQCLRLWHARGSGHER